MRKNLVVGRRADGRPIYLIRGGAPTSREIVEKRIAALDVIINDLFDKRGALLDKATAESRGLSDVEKAEYDRHGDARSAAEAERAPLIERLAELAVQEQRESAAAANRVRLGNTSGEERGTGGAHVTDPTVYARDKFDTSYLQDLFNARYRADDYPDAAQRLRRNTAAQRETRALTTVAGAGGEFAPPEWIINEFVQYARPGRKFADSLDPMTLPGGLSSINIPKVTGGTTTAIQATQNSALSQTDITTGSVSSSISTIGGKQVVSMQLLEQSGFPMDQVVTQDLAADYAKQFSSQAINGSGLSGQLEGVYTYFAASGTVNVTYTSAAPAVASTTAADSLYTQIFAASSKIATNRFVDPDTIWMHPRRWAWILASVDGNSRPLVVPAGNGFNPIAVENGVITQGFAGTFGGLPVITDPNMPTNVSSTRDVILVGVRSDLKLWESSLQLESFTATYADSAGVLFRAMAYSAAIPNRYTTSVAVISGTGLAAPSGF